MLLDGLEPTADALVLTQVLGLSMTKPPVCGCPLGTIRSRVAW